jgi:hypothetical protein
MEECLHTLENHPDALPSDKKIIWWARLGQIIEESSTQLTTDDPQSIVTFADSKIRYAVKGFSNQLAQWRREVPEEAYSRKFACHPEEFGILMLLTRLLSDTGPYISRHQSVRP